MDTIEQWLSWLDKLEGLPAVGLVFLSCIVVGYAWRFIHLSWFPNEAIPLAVIAWGAFAMSMIADNRATDVPFRVWCMRNVIVGAVIGFAAWLAHNVILKRVEDWILAKAPQLWDTTFFNKQNDCKPAPPPEPRSPDGK